jgi:hypothetical protein
MDTAHHPHHPKKSSTHDQRRVLVASFASVLSLMIASAESPSLFWLPLVVVSTLVGIRASRAILDGAPADRVDEHEIEWQRVTGHLGAVAVASSITQSGVAVAS